jgi:superfamily II DNA or RNA helicase
MKINFYPHQQPLFDEIIAAYPYYTKILAQAETGWGKSVLIGGLANYLPGRSLILTHRIELLEQNAEWIEDVGILTTKVKKVQGLKESKNVISMAQTCAARFKKFGSDYLGEFQNVIVDEIHVDFFKQVYTQLPNVKVIAVTATPIITKKIKKIEQGIEYIKKLTLKDEFDILLQGVNTQELIDLGYLTRDFNVQLTPPNLEELKNSESTPDGYTSKSLTEVFGSHATMETVIEGYKTYCGPGTKNGVGKKTIIFNPTTKVNKIMYDAFLKMGIDCKIYDSVNPTENTRKEITTWFKTTPGAVLLNVGVFTTGFSVNNLEAIIYNKKTKSLSLWLQSIGRGCRVLTKEQIANGQIKDSFLVLDMGLNIAEHGKWSDDRDWNKFFINNPWKQKKETDLLQMWECKSCSFFNLKGQFFNQTLERIECESCHEPKPPPPEPKYIKGKFVVLEEPIYPQAAKLMKYAERVGGDGNMVLKLARTQILDLFKYHTTVKDYKARTKRYEKRISELYRPIYFSVLNSKTLQSSRKKLASQLEQIQNNIEEFYGF